ncbi:MAG: peptidoglycan DD-metalloendopeptidase family protein [Armatimonadota bacterium]
MVHTDKGALPITGRLSSPFGDRVHPILKTKKFHNGVDIAAVQGTPLPALWTGKVVTAAFHGAGGNTVSIDAGMDGKGRRITYSYCHLHTIDVHVGMSVPAGRIVGTVGSTGRSTGPHLHFTVRVNGVAVDPQQFQWAATAPPARMESYLVVDGERLPGEIIDNKLYVPARPACTLLGLACEYVQPQQAVQFGESFIAGPLIDGALYVPARALCDQAGYTVTWKANTKELLATK